ncbi:MAG: recombinase family protein, partial [Chloroflexota bacterium]|nr:recombinase family protein [Chloroflexota bacterium]
GCQVLFVDRPMRDDPHDQLVLQVRGAVAEYERQLIIDRMRRGRLTKLRNGQLLPWTRAPYGSMLDPDHPRDPSRLRIDPVTSVIVQQIFAWYTDPQTPLTLYGVARRLNDTKVPTSRGGAYWAISTLCRLMRNPVYIGTAWSDRTHAAPTQQRASRLRPVGRGQTSRRVPREDWMSRPTYF